MRNPPGRKYFYQEFFYSLTSADFYFNKMEAKCKRCGKENTKWNSGETYKGLDEHHNPPQFMMNEWKGELYFLCRECHKELHQKIIVPLLNNFARTLKYNGSEYWIWFKILPIDKPNAIKKVYNTTKDFIENVNTTNITTKGN